MGLQDSKAEPRGERLKKQKVNKLKRDLASPRGLAPPLWYRGPETLNSILFIDHVFECDVMGIGIDCVEWKMFYYKSSYRTWLHLPLNISPSLSD